MGKWVEEQILTTRMPSPIPIQKRLGFWAALLLAPVAFFLALEACLRLFHYGGSTALFVPAGAPYRGYLRVNPNVGKRFFFRQSTLPLPPNDVFLERKPDDGIRLFVLGESTTLGFPYGNLLMFPRILQARLQDSMPGRRVEVVNVSLTAVSTVALADFTAEILRQKPDAILVYAGHNEFYGALGAGSVESAGKSPWLVRAYLTCIRFKTGLLVRDAMTRLIDATRKPGPRDGTLMERIAAERFIPLYGPLYRAGVSQFERNLGSILEAAAAASVPAAVGELVSNARDQKPLASAAFDTLRPADDVYAEAQTLESQGKFAEAKAAYEKARDLDMLRFRAPSGMNVALRRVAALHGAVVVPVASAFEQASPHRLVGSNLMVDHLHPNLDGCFLLADAFYQSLRQNRILVADWDSLAERPAGHYRKTWPVTGLDSAIADLMIRQLMAGWPFRPAGTENRALKDFRPGSMNQALALDVILQKTSAEAAHYAHARHSEASGDTASAQRDYDAITRLVFIEAYAYLDRGLAFLRSGNKDNALRMFEKSLESEEIPLALRLAGSIHLEKGNFRESIRLLEKARGRNPARADVVHDLCLAYFRAGEPDKAADCYDALRKTNASGKWKDLEPLFRVR